MIIVLIIYKYVCYYVFNNVFEFIEIEVIKIWR